MNNTSSRSSKDFALEDWKLKTPFMAQRKCLCESATAEKKVGGRHSMGRDVHV